MASAQLMRPFTWVLRTYGCAWKACRPDRVAVVALGIDVAITTTRQIQEALRFGNWDPISPLEAILAAMFMAFFALVITIGITGAVRLFLYYEARGWTLWFGFVYVLRFREGRIAVGAFIAAITVGAIVSDVLSPLSGPWLTLAAVALLPVTALCAFGPLLYAIRTRFGYNEHNLPRIFAKVFLGANGLIACAAIAMMEHHTFDALSALALIGTIAVSIYEVTRSKDENELGLSQA